MAYVYTKMNSDPKKPFPKIQDYFPLETDEGGDEPVSDKQERLKKMMAEAMAKVKQD